MMFNIEVVCLILGFRVRCKRYTLMDENIIVFAVGHVDK
jgi:hypothetical protein